MAIKTPPIGQVTALWQQRSQAATTEYKNGVAAAGNDWQAGVDGAADNWSQGVSQAAGNGAYSKGVQGKASTYVDKATNVGSTRYASGVAAAGNAYNSGMGKVLGVISGVNLPPRNVAGSNQGRSDAVASALHQAKTTGQI